MTIVNFVIFVSAAVGRLAREASSPPAFPAAPAIRFTTNRDAPVLLALRAEDRRGARRLLRGALKSNRRVPAYLTGQKELPEILPLDFAIGSIEEAVLCAHDLLDPWLATPGAVEWLRAETRKAR